MVQPVVAFTFTAAGTSDELEGVLHSPAAPGPLTPALIVCHGLNNNMHLPLLVDLCQGVAEAGMYALRFNFRYVTRPVSPEADALPELADMEGALMAVQRD